MASGTINNSEVLRFHIANGTDFDSLTAPLGADMLFYGDNISSMINKPSTEVSSFPFAIDVVNLGGYKLQKLMVYTSSSAPREYRRQQYYSSGNRPYGAWVQTV